MDEFTALFSRKDMTFEEAVAYFKERVPVTASRFYQIAAEYRALAFTVSGYTKAQVLKKFYDELLAALEEGNSLAEFRENMNDFLEAEGYEGITPYQAENIFRTNIQFLLTPPRGGRLGGAAEQRAIRYFYSRPRVGGDIFSTHLGRMLSIFLLTPPHGGRLFRDALIRHQILISTHAPA